MHFGIALALAPAGGQPVQCIAEHGKMRRTDLADIINAGRLGKKAGRYQPRPLHGLGRQFRCAILLNQMTTFLPADLQPFRIQPFRGRKKRRIEELCRCGCGLLRHCDDGLVNGRGGCRCRLSRDGGGHQLRAIHPPSRAFACHEFSRDLLGISSAIPASTLSAAVRWACAAARPSISSRRKRRSAVPSCAVSTPIKNWKSEAIRRVRGSDRISPASIESVVSSAARSCGVAPVPTRWSTNGCPKSPRGPFSAMRFQAVAVAQSARSSSSARPTGSIRATRCTRRIRASSYVITWDSQVRASSTEIRLRVRSSNIRSLSTVSFRAIIQASARKPLRKDSCRMSIDVDNPGTRQRQ